MKTSFGTIGQTNESGSFYLNDIERLNDFANQLPNRRFFVSIELVDKEPSKAMLGYFYLYMLPAFRQAYREEIGEHYTLKEVEIKLAEYCPPCIEEQIDVMGVTMQRVKEFRELKNEELKQAILQLQIIGAKHFNLVLDKS